jgi:hypothetical protein
MELHFRLTNLNLICTSLTLISPSAPLVQMLGRHVTDGCMENDEQSQVPSCTLLRSRETGPSAFNNKCNKN